MAKETSRIELNCSAGRKASGPIDSQHLYTNWTDANTTKFINAVETVVKINPILNGCAVAESKSKTHVTTNVFPSVVKIKTLNLYFLRKNFELIDMSPNSKLELLQTEISPLTENLGTGFQQIQQKSRLFQVTLFELGNNTVVISFCTSGLITDEIIHLEIIDSIKTAMKNESEPGPLNLSTEYYNSIKDVIKINGLKKVKSVVENLKFKLKKDKRTTKTVLVSKDSLSEVEEKLKAGRKLTYLNVTLNDVGFQFGDAVHQFGVCFTEKLKTCVKDTVYVFNFDMDNICLIHNIQE
jgi:hypothetical protein